MRREMTEEEDSLWPFLKDRGFSAQVPLFMTRYNKGIVADFYHLRLKLRIEVDGPQHKRSADQREDRKLLADLGLTTLRFTNKQVRSRLPWVLETLSELLD